MASWQSSSLSTSDESQFVPHSSVVDDSAVTDYVVSSIQSEHDHGHGAPSREETGVNGTEHAIDTNQSNEDAIPGDEVTICPTPDHSPCPTPLRHSGVSDSGSLYGLSSDDGVMDSIVQSAGSLAEYDLLDEITPGGGNEVGGLMNGDVDLENNKEEDHSMKGGFEPEAFNCNASQLQGDSGDLATMLTNDSFSPNTTVEDSESTLPNSTSKNNDVLEKEEVTKDPQAADDPSHEPSASCEDPQLSVASKDEITKQEETEDKNYEHHTSPRLWVGMLFHSVVGRFVPETGKNNLYLANTRDIVSGITASFTSYILSALACIYASTCSHVCSLRTVATKAMSGNKGMGVEASTCSAMGALVAKCKKKALSCKAIFAIVALALLSVVFIHQWEQFSGTAEKSPEEDFLCFSSNSLSFEGIVFWEYMLSPDVYEAYEEEAILEQISSVEEPSSLMTLGLKSIIQLVLIILVVTWKVNKKRNDSSKDNKNALAKCPSSKPDEPNVSPPVQSPTPPRPPEHELCEFKSDPFGRASQVLPVVTQPPQALPIGTEVLIYKHEPDGDCIFSGLAFGWNRVHPNSTPLDSIAVRQELALLVQPNRGLVFNGKTLEEWIGMEFPQFLNKENRVDIGGYVNMMLRGAWGGTVEMVLFARFYGISISVYADLPGCKNEFHQVHVIADERNPSQDTIHLLYRGGVHYDSLVSSSEATSSKEYGEDSTGTIVETIVAQETPSQTVEPAILWSDAAKKRKNELLKEEKSSLNEAAKPEFAKGNNVNLPADSNPDVVCPRFEAVVLDSLALEARVELAPDVVAPNAGEDARSTRKKCDRTEAEKSAHKEYHNVSSPPVTPDSAHDDGEVCKGMAKAHSPEKSAYEVDATPSDNDSKLITELSDKLETLLAENSQLRQQLENAMPQDKPAPREEIQELLVKKDSIIEEISTRNAEIMARCQDLEQEKESLAVENAHLLSHNTELNERVESLEVGYATLEQNLSSVEAENACVVRNVIETASVCAAIPGMM